jgi:hypothetical protein
MGYGDSVRIRRYLLLSLAEAIAYSIAVDEVPVPRKEQTHISGSNLSLLYLD